MAGRPVTRVRVIALAVTGLLLVDPLLVRVRGLPAVRVRRDRHRRRGSAAGGGACRARPASATRSAVTLAAQLGVAPVLLGTFGPIPVASVPANLLAVPVAGLVMVWGLTAGLVAGAAGEPLAALLHSPTRVRARLAGAGGAVARRARRSASSGSVHLGVARRRPRDGRRRPRPPHAPPRRVGTRAGRAAGRGGHGERTRATSLGPAGRRRAVAQRRDRRRGARRRGRTQLARQRVGARGPAPVWGATASTCSSSPTRPCAPTWSRPCSAPIRLVPSSRTAPSPWTRPVRAPVRVPGGHVRHRRRRGDRAVRRRRRAARRRGDATVAVSPDRRASPAAVGSALVDGTPWSVVWEVPCPEVALGPHRFDVRHRALVMGILNRTPDSFYDQGGYFDFDGFLAKADQLVAEGADLLDVGGVKAGPGPEVTAERGARPGGPRGRGAARSASTCRSRSTPGGRRCSRGAGGGCGRRQRHQRLRRPRLPARRGGGGRVRGRHPHPARAPGARSRARVRRLVVDAVCRFLRARGEAAEAAGIPASA